MKRLLAMLLLLCLPLTALAENPVWVGSQQAEGYVRETPIDMPAGDAYQVQPWGVTTWRGGSYRQNAAVGTLEGAAVGLELAWTTETGALYLDATERFWGFSWYSQPVIVKWAIQIRQSMITLTDEAWNTAGLREVIFPSLDGKVYFLNLTDGTATRNAIDVGYPLLGAATLHPLGYPLMLTGQYSDMLRYGRGSIGAHWHELLTQRSIRFVDGKMEALGVNDAYTGAFNTSALIDHTTSTAVSLSKDGYLYTVQLDTHLYTDGTGNELVKFTVDFAPAVIAKVTEGDEEVTSALSMDGSLLYFGTDRGRLICVDATTMQTRWTLQLSGPLYATPALEQTADGLVVYAGAADAVYCLDADSGEVIWHKAFTAADGLADHGVIASPVVGRNALDGLVFFAATTQNNREGRVDSHLVALDKLTGEVVWKQTVSTAEASPVAVYDASGSGWVISTDRYGGLTLLDGLTGQVLDTLFLDMRAMSSPAVYGDMLVVGGAADQGGRVFGVRIVTEQAEVAPLSAEQQCLEDFLHAWSLNNQAGMLPLCAPSWRDSQTDAAQMLFMLVRNRSLMAWRIGEPVQSGEGLVCEAEVRLYDYTGSDPQWYRLTLALVQEDGAWYVDPTGLAAAVLINVL